MSAKTYFTVHAVQKRGRRLENVQPISCRSDSHAIARAERDARRFQGVIAVRQVADDETGDLLEEPVVLAVHGEFPMEALGI